MKTQLEHPQKYTAEAKMSAILSCKEQVKTTALSQSFKVWNEYNCYSLYLQIKRSQGTVSRAGMQLSTLFN